MAGDVLDEPVDEQGAAGPPGERIVGQGADRVVEADRICGGTCEGLGEMVAMTGEEVQGYRFRRQPCAQLRSCTAAGTVAWSRSSETDQTVPTVLG